MSIYKSDSNVNNIDRILDNWEYPLEAIVPDPKYTQPLKIVKQSCSIKEQIESIKEELNYGEVLLCHETDYESAKDIMNTGFNIDRFDETPIIRNNAVYGWLNKVDIGYYKSNIDNNSDYLVLFKADSSDIFISSFKSAKELYLTGMSRWEYEKDYVLNYEDYEELLISGKLESIGYKPTSSILSKTY